MHPAARQPLLVRHCRRRDASAKCCQSIVVSIAMEYGLLFRSQHRKSSPFLTALFSILLIGPNHQRTCQWQKWKKPEQMRRAKRSIPSKILPNPAVITPVIAPVSMASRQSSPIGNNFSLIACIQTHPFSMILYRKSPTCMAHVGDFKNMVGHRGLEPRTIRL